MINLAHLDFSGNLIWNENQHLGELVVENPKFLREILKDLTILEEPKELKLTENGGALKYEKDIDVIVNPVKLDFSNRRAGAALIKMLVKTSLSEDFYLSTNKLKAKIIKFMNEVVDAENFIFEVEADDFMMDKIAKAINIHVVDDEDDFVELLTDYMAMMTELAEVKLFVFLNLREFLGAEELLRLIKNAANHEFNILLLEGKDLGKIEEIPRIVIDRDLCEI